MNEIKVRYHRELYPDLLDVQINENGDFVDLRAAHDVHLNPGEFTKISLGVSIELPKGKFAVLVPRSSTFEKYGIIQTNSMGVIDNTYSGDNDIWSMPVYALRECNIKANERIAQFKIFSSEDMSNIVTVDHLENNDRGGYGSTGRV